MDKCIEIKKVQLLADDWGVLKKTTFAYRRRDGQWETQSRETYDRGNGATILLYNRECKTIMLLQYAKLHCLVDGPPSG